MAITKAAGLPVTRDVHFAKRVNRDLDFEGLIFTQWLLVQEFLNPILPVQVL